MSKRPLSRRRLLATAAPFAAAPLVAKLALEGTPGASAASHAGMDMPGMEMGGMDMNSAPMIGHAAMIGDHALAAVGANDLDALLYPPTALPYEPGRVREYTLTALDREIEVAPGVFFPAWTYNGTVPGPVIRATEGDMLRVKFQNAGTHPHSIHFHGVHPTNMDGAFEIVQPGGEFTYEFEARPAALHLYHCHATPLKKHIAKGLYGAFI